MSYPPPPGYGQQPQQPGYPPQQPGGYAPQPPQQPYGQQQPSQPGYGAPQQPGYGAPQQPGYPPQAGGAYGAPPPMPPGGGGGGFGEFAKETGKGLLWKIVPVILVVLGVGIYFVVKLAGGDSFGDAASDLGDSDSSASIAVDDCLSSFDTVTTSTTGDPLAEIVVDCTAAEAVWKVTKVEEDADDVRADSLGELEDYEGITAICGAEVLSYQFGQSWKNFNFVYDQGGGLVDYVACVEAVDTPDADGRTRVMPDAGTCTDDDPEWWYTIDCSAAGALYTVDEVETYDPPIEESAFDAAAAVGGCANSDYQSAAVYGNDGLIYGAMCMSDNV